MHARAASAAEFDTNSACILDIRDLHRSFGGLRAVDGAGFTVRRGSITGLIGPNGAGKTTMFNLIAGSIKPDSGAILFEGRNVAGWPTHRLSELGLLRTFQLARGLGALTVLENVALYAKSQPGESLWRALLRVPSVAAREQSVIGDAWDLVRQLNLTRVANDQAADLSGGQKKLVELGRVLLGAPKLLLLDEPMAGVNPALAAELAARLLALRDAGITMLVVEHNMGLISRICDHVIVMAAGKVLAEGSFETVRANETVQSAYFGTLT